MHLSVQLHSGIAYFVPSVGHAARNINDFNVMRRNIIHPRLLGKEPAPKRRCLS